MTVIVELKPVSTFMLCQIEESVEDRTVDNTG